jgi:hypothetical protein
MTWLPLPPGTTVGDLPVAPAPFMGPDGVMLMTATTLVVPFTTRELYALTARQGRFAVSGRAAVTREGVDYRIAVTRGAFALAGRSIMRRRGINVAADAGSYSVEGAATSLDYAEGNVLTFNVTGMPVTISASFPLNYSIAAGRGSFGVTGITAPWIPLPATYSQRSVSSVNDPATVESMQNGRHTETMRTVTNSHTDATRAWVSMDLGADTSFSRIHVGCDFDNTLNGGWGKFFTENAEIQAATASSGWSTIVTLTTFSQPIQSYSVPGAFYRYVRIRRSGFLALTEFYVTTQ